MLRYRNPLLANKPTPSAGSRVKCNGAWQEAAELERSRTLCCLPQSLPAIPLAPATSPPPTESGSLCCQGALVLRVETRASHTTGTPDAAAQVPARSPTGVHDLDEKDQVRFEHKGTKPS